MSFGGPVLKQHIVEFIRGVGIVTNGVVDPTSLNGPFTWTVPEGVARLQIDGAAGGQSGQGGAPFSAGVTSMGGGSGGVPGQCIRNADVTVRPLSLLTITLGAGGAATAAGVNYNTGENTTIAGTLAGNISTTGLNTILLRGGAQFSTQPTASVGGQGLGAGGATGAGGDFASTPDPSPNSHIGGIVMSGADSVSVPLGGAGNASGAVAGFSGGRLVQWNASTGVRFGLGMQAYPAGTTDGTISRGGGGSGIWSLFGRAGLGGSGAAGENSPSFGAGGGGGAGGFGGGSGGDGYVAFTFWKAD